MMGQRQTYNSIHKPQQSHNETIGFNQDDHPYRMCNETGIPEFLEFAIPGICNYKILSTRAPYITGYKDSCQNYALYGNLHILLNI